MKKGQLSLDLMLTIIVALLLVQVFITFTEQLTDTERSNGIRAQEENIGNDLLELINQTKMFDEYGKSDFNITYKAPYLYDPDKRGGQDCNITITKTSSPDINISYVANNLEMITVIKDLNFNFVNTTKLYYKCGQTIILTREELGEKT